MLCTCGSQILTYTRVTRLLSPALLWAHWRSLWFRWAGGAWEWAFLLSFWVLLLLVRGPHSGIHGSGGFGWLPMASGVLRCWRISFLRAASHFLTWFVNHALLLNSSSHPLTGGCRVLKKTLLRWGRCPETQKRAHLKLWDKKKHLHPHGYFGFESHAAYTTERNGPEEIILGVRQGPQQALRLSQGSHHWLLRWAKRFFRNMQEERRTKTGVCETDVWQAPS